MRRCRMASSSSRATCSGQNDAPCAIMPSISAGGAASGALIEMVAMRLGAIDIDIDKTIADAVVVDGARQRRQRDALALPLRFEAAANSFARSATLASSLLFGTISSTSRHCTARLPLMPSSMVQK